MNSLIKLLASFGIIEITLATTLGLAINNLLKDFNKLIISPLLNIYVVDLVHMKWGGMDIGLFISALLEFLIFIFIITVVLSIILRPLIDDINKVKNEHEIRQVDLLQDLKEIEEQKKRLLFPSWMS